MSRSFVGAKGGAGVAEWLLSMMPAHERYIEAFAGTGVLIRRKKPARADIAIEASAAVLEGFWMDQTPPHVTVRAGDCLEVLPQMCLCSRDLVYADPPYLGSTRGNREYYAHEMMTEADHLELIKVLRALPAMVMLSGYWSDLYSDQLAGWRVSSRWTVNRGGRRCQEFCWMNFPEPVFFHQCDYSGRNFTDRQRIKRKVSRWVRRFASMSPAERQAVYEGLQSCL